ncbi:EAL domain-containing protein [Cupriavidus sp. M-11]|uniref:EAL domain-containing protein n=1 Tax=Cupriavidus sp. M-11 TaxID=3233038 RepID=UPI003F9396A2
MGGRHDLRVIWPFLPIMLILVLLSGFSVDMLSAARAYVGGESLWSKGQKAAVMHLMRYADSHDEAEFRAYERAIAVPLGDRQARLEFASDRLDYDKAAAGLLAGGNHVDDISGMIRLMRHFGRLPAIDRALAIWGRADNEVLALRDLADQLHASVRAEAAEAADKGEIRLLLQRIGETDDRLTPLEAAFSYSLGEISRQVRNLLMPGIGIAAILLMLPGILMANRSVRKELLLREALARSEERLALAISGSNDGLWDWDLRSDALYFSARCAQMLGYEEHELPRLLGTVRAHCHPDDLACVESQMRRHLREGIPYDCSFRLRNRAGGYLWVRSRGRMVRDAAGHARRMAGSLTDISDQKRAEAQLLAEKERAQVTLQAIGDAVITVDVHGHVDALNPAAELLTGWHSADAKGRPLHVVCPLSDEASRSPLTGLGAAVLQKTWPRFSTLLLERPERAPIAVKLSVALIHHADRTCTGAVLVLHDVSSERADAARLSHEASHDALTGLVNRIEFERRLAEAMRRVRSEDCTHTLMYLDLDQFKVVNDTCGHAAGDELIRQLAVVMRATLRESDTLARLGGDEFGVLLDGCHVDNGERVAEAMREAIARFRFVHRQRTFAVSASIGMISLDRDMSQVAEALSAADAACYLAKERGRNRVQVYRQRDEAVRALHGEMEWVSRIHTGLEAGRFCLHAQEIAPLQAGGAQGRHVELLLRMLDDAGQLVPPMAFIPACERYNLMPALDRWVIEAGFAALAGCLGDRPGDIAVCGINLSGASLGDQLLPAYIAERAARHGIPLRHVCFEITETAAIGNLAQAATFIEQLQDKGCSFALDDFGAGMSSFAYLKHLPTEYIKIDGGFVNEMFGDPVNLVVIEAIQRIANAMGKKTIAEWVDSDAKLAKLRALGVDYAQGFGVARPGHFAGPREAAQAG